MSAVILSLSTKSQVLSSNYLFSIETRSQLNSHDWKLREMIFDPHVISILSNKGGTYISVARIHTNYLGEKELLNTIWHCSLIESITQKDSSTVINQYSCSFQEANDFFYPPEKPKEVHVKITSETLESIFWYQVSDNTTTRIRYIPHD